MLWLVRELQMVQCVWLEVLESFQNYLASGWWIFSVPNLHNHSARYVQITDFHLVKNSSRLHISVALASYRHVSTGTYDVDVLPNEIPSIYLQSTIFRAFRVCNTHRYKDIHFMSHIYWIKNMHMSTSYWLNMQGTSNLPLLTLSSGAVWRESFWPFIWSSSHQEWDWQDRGLWDGFVFLHPCYQIHVVTSCGGYCMLLALGN